MGRLRARRSGPSHALDPAWQLLDGEPRRRGRDLARGIPASPGCDAPLLDEIAWYCGNSQGPQEVRRKRPNAWGLYDMLGNVSEWCRDSGYPGGSYAAPKQEGPERILRGGSWADAALDVRSAARQWMAPERRSDDVGFRIAASAIT